MRLFGTDGIRGKVNEWPITADAALGLGKAFVALVSKNNGGKIKIAIGRDTRVSGSMLEEALIAGVTSSGADALPFGVVPSNAVSYLLQLKDCDGGIMISASHNPADENGFKFFSSEGFKVPEEAEKELERIFFSKEFVKSETPGSVFRVRDVKQNYISMITDSLQGSDLSGLKVAVDAGNGAASYIVKDLLHELKAEATIINNEPDGNNINKGGALFPEQLQKLVRENKLDAGVAFDGDADRLVMVDELGNVVEGDALIAAAAVNLKTKGKLNKNRVVVTGYSNIGLDVSLRKLGINVTRVNTGDKNVGNELFKHRLSVGGESSGHILFPEFSKTADAVLSSVQILNVMKEQGRKLSELAAVLEKYPQILMNVDVREKRELNGMPAVISKIKEAEKKLGGNGRVFVRYSGTENKLRILVEGESESEIKKLANDIAEAVKSEIGK